MFFEKVRLIIVSLSERLMEEHVWLWKYEIFELYELGFGVAS